MACNDALTTTLNEFVSKSKEVSRLSKNCYKENDGSCKDLKRVSLELMSEVDSEDLGLRWDHFSCSPLLFSKLRYMGNKAEKISILASLAKKTEELDREANHILEPNTFIESELENIKVDCCQKRSFK